MSIVNAILVSLYHRVILAYKSTLLGIALVAADAIVSQLQGASLPGWAHAVVGIVASILVLLKKKEPEPTA